MDRKQTIRVLRLLQLLACGAAIGLYIAKAFGYVGFEVTPFNETLGIGAGAAIAGVLKFLHLV